MLYLQTIFKMKKVLFYILAVISFTAAQAQINEVGIFVGGSNYIGDVGPTTYISPNKPALGLLYKWNRSTRHAYRFSISYADITADDLDSKVASRKNRGLNFNNSITEFSAGIEFNFFEFDLHHGEKQFTPYVATGINYFLYNEKFYVEPKAKTDYREGALSIPMTVGVKGRIFGNFVLGFETGVRYTFTDNLDGSNPKNENFETLRFGNLNSKDWYVFTGFTLTYTFGDNPCFCAE